MPTTEPQTRWFQLTPGRFVLLLLAVECLLWLSDRFGWLAWHKGYAVLTGVAVVGVAMVLMGVWFGVAMIFRWRFQFSLRSLLVLVVVVAVPCSWLAVSIKEAKTQRDVVSVIQMAGGEAYYDDRELGCQLHGYAWNDEPSFSLLPAWAMFDFFYSMSHVRLSRHCSPAEPCHVVIVSGDIVVTPELLMHVARLPELQYLNLAGTNVDDACLEPLRKLRELAHVDLRCTQVTEVGVANLREAIPTAKISWGWNGVSYRHGINGAMYNAGAQDGTTIANEREIRSLDVCFRRVTDADLIQLENTWPELEHLVLWQCEITDAGLEHLKGLSHLRTLGLWDFDRTDEGVKRFQQALPNCKIEHAIY